MKRLYLIIYLCALTMGLSAHETVPALPDSLLPLLQSIAESQTDYTIDIASDGLEEL